MFLAFMVSTMVVAGVVVVSLIGYLINRANRH
jgi:hypothetical protein